MQLYSFLLRLSDQRASDYACGDLNELLYYTFISNSVRAISADYIFPIVTDPIKNGIIILDDDGTILDLISPGNSDNFPGEDVEHYEGIICPGFINTHCHLELSHLKGKLPEKKGLDEFIKEIEVTRKADELEIAGAILKAEDEMLANGIVAVGDISNGNLSFAQKAKQRLRYHTFIEVFAFAPERADKAYNKALLLLRDYLLLNQNAPSVSITPHAPYSASEKLLQKISNFAKKDNSILSIHNQESEEENLFYEKKEGKILKRLEHFGIDTSAWIPTGKSALQSILKYLPNSRKILLVHNTYTSEEDIQWAQHYSNNIYWCFCPNANLYIENTLPAIKEFIKEDVKITIGTDSLASNWSLSVLDELKTISNHYPEIALNTLLTWATRNGAEFLGFNKELGTIEKGKLPGLNLIKNTKELTLCKETTVERLV